ncbi:unnamed protein product (macronuclear) [Paramecium tetraurelia]|uniref:Uncharacterized protein n=1 Tax=Paramecium tetraurelia TaxID=5888 RepID=A0CY28_PARTE|nr:uncharacterized protein GSPATT00011327001 [Paramecium tetraurelia]CAK75695.1 unnamed protein product [Paramecium tetraurelia]|eukprot:XP_001443092.1 hypothetical protein (macronuclear) [Paramecium tetraurelia strain d4-2]
MYFYNQSTNIGNFSQLVDDNKYLHLEPYNTPKEIEHFKKCLRRYSDQKWQLITSFMQVPFYVVVDFIVVLTSLCIYGSKQEKQDKLESKEQSQNYIEIIRVIRKGGVPQEKLD